MNLKRKSQDKLRAMSFMCWGVTSRWQTILHKQRLTLKQIVIVMRDTIKLKKRLRAEKGLDELTKMSQEMGLYDDQEKVANESRDADTTRDKT